MGKERENLKTKFLNELNKDTVFTERHFICILSYSDDEEFPSRLRKRLNEIDRDGVKAEYNKWLIEWKKKKDKQDKEVGSWLSKRINDWYDRQVGQSKKEVREREWENGNLATKKKLLLQKKLLLLKER